MPGTSCRVSGPKRLVPIRFLPPVQQTTTPQLLFRMRTRRTEKQTDFVSVRGLNCYMQGTAYLIQRTTLGLAL